MCVLVDPFPDALLAAVVIVVVSSRAWLLTNTLRAIIPPLLPSAAPIAAGRPLLLPTSLLALFPLVVIAVAYVALHARKNLELLAAAATRLGPICLIQLSAQAQNARLNNTAVAPIR